MGLEDYQNERTIIDISNLGILYGYTAVDFSCSLKLSTLTPKTCLRTESALPGRCPRSLNASGRPCPDVIDSSGI